MKKKLLGKRIKFWECTQTHRGLRLPGQGVIVLAALISMLSGFWAWGSANCFAQQSSEVVGLEKIAEAERHLQQAGQETDDTKRSFEFKYRAWKEYIKKPEVSRESAVSPYIKNRAFEEIVALGDEKWSVRVNAARALGEIGDRRAIGPLRKALEDRNPAVAGSC